MGLIMASSMCNVVVLSQVIKDEITYTGFTFLLSLRNALRAKVFKVNPMLTLKHSCA